jgi:GGDEF domain-containing protein
MIEDLGQEPDAVQVAQKIVDGFTAPLAVQDHSCCVSISASIPVFPTKGIAHDLLLEHADIAMTRCKGVGPTAPTWAKTRPASAAMCWPTTATSMPAPC